MIYYVHRKNTKEGNREMKPHTSVTTARHSGDPAGDREFVTLYEIDIFLPKIGPRWCPM